MVLREWDMRAHDGGRGSIQGRGWGADADGATCFMGVSEFAARCSISRTTAERWLASGLVASVRIGGRRLIPGAEFDRLVSAAYAAAS